MIVPVILSGGAGTRLWPVSRKLYPSGSIHALENPRLEPLLLIEVQCGSCFCEDDIVRLEDKYGRD